MAPNKQTRHAPIFFKQSDLQQNGFTDYRKTMEATKVFENILTFIKASNLNYCLEQTDFSDQISLKDSVIKETGAPLKLLPLLDLDKLKFLEHENDMLVLKVNDLKIGWNQMESEKIEIEIKRLELLLENSNDDDLINLYKVWQNQNIMIKKIHQYQFISSDWKLLE